MVHHGKASALNKRANSAVRVLDQASRYLRGELAKQRPLKQGPKFTDDEYPETIELKRKDIESLADRLRTIQGELGERTWPDMS